MSGFLSGLLTAVAIVATVVSGGTLGILAGALIAGSYAASKGWIGGSVGAFFNSSAGKGLTMAVGLATAATGIMSATSAVAPTASSSAVTTANAEAGVNAATAPGMAAVGDAATNAVNAASPTLSGTAAQTMAPGSLSQMATTLDSDGSLAASNGLSQQELAQNDVLSQASSKALGLPTNASPQVSGAPATGAASTGQTDIGQATATANQNSQAAVNPAGSTNDVTSASAGQNLNPVDTSQAVGQGKVNAAAGEMNQANIDSTPTAPQGMLGKAASFVGQNPGVAVAGGQALSGMAQGMSAQKTMQEQIAAAQWGNMQWQNPTQVAQLNAQAAQPINVPVGYLNRAAAVRNMMNGSTSQTAPLQTNGSGGVSPSTPQAMAPVGMGNGPIPPAGLPATPRGGM